MGALDLRQLAAFTTVAETGSFADAARRLGYTQPAVSHQIAGLEQTVGQRLIDRGSGRNGATLTAAGEVFATHVEAIAARLASARADFENLDAGESGVLRVGAFQSVAARILPRLATELTRSAPSVSIELTESADEDELFRRLDHGELDYAFTLLPLDDERFAAVELLEDGYYLAGIDGGDRGAEIRSLKDLDQMPIVAPRTCRSSEMIDAQLRASGVAPTYVFRTDDNFALKGFVQSGAGVAFVTKLTLETLGPDVDAVSVEHLVPPRRIALAWPRDRQTMPLHDLFVSLTRQICADLG